MINQQSFKQWLPSLGLGLAGFIYVTTEFIPVGLLPEIAVGIHKSEAFIGIMMTIYAWIVATMSLPMTVWTAGFNRRKLMLTLLVLFTFAHVIAMSATNFPILMLSRVIIALLHSIFWSITIPLAVRVAPPGKEAKSLALVSTTTTLGSILGIPLGTFIGQMFGWRWAFGSIGLGALIILCSLYKTFPNLESQNAGSFKSVPGLFKNKIIALMYLVTAVSITGYFTAFTYIKPYLRSVGHYSPNDIVFILFVFGVSGIVGSIIGGKALTFSLRKPLLVSLSVVATSLLLWKAFTFSLVALAVLAFFWGASTSVLSLVFQATIISSAPDAQDVATSLYSGIFNIGIGSGALIGSFVSTHYLEHVGYLGAGFLLLALFISLAIPFHQVKKTFGGSTSLH
jgi:DHA1 family purine ribonucleoside efflux pump-like MFS transporter/DHA1 family L-arabinose/isopropyl-beta-D-thiogalactopyranoside export protein-like MFS transporter